MPDATRTSDVSSARRSMMPGRASPIRLMLASALLVLAACAMPPAEPGAKDAGDAAAATPTSTAPVQETETLAQADPPAAASPRPDPRPGSEPAPAVAPAPADGPARLDMSCRTDADCTVKNVGNCCGAYPACVNVNSPTDPEGVKAACAKSGMMSTCGFREIQGCQCVAGTCQSDDDRNVQIQ